jgi:16S rRNA processing protein RimM
MNDRQHLPETVVVGRVRKPHGVRGELTAEVLSDVERRFDVGESLIVRLADGSSHIVEVASSRAHGDLRILRFEGDETRDDVETLRGAHLEVARASVPEAPEGAFYYYELTGCEVRDRTAGVLGRVGDVLEDGGGWLLEVERGADRLLIPFVEAYLVEVDIAGRRIQVELPPGLIELCTSTS